MERIAQYLDDLEDLVYAVALVAERLRRAVRRIVAVFLALAMLALGFLLALSQPPLALAAVSLLMVTALYRAAVGNARGNSRGTIPGT
jgi:uncharacterized membrane protein YgaE (UPF0421/DUF939 family)